MREKPASQRCVGVQALQSSHTAWVQSVTVLQFRAPHTPHDHCLRMHAFPSTYPREPSQVAQKRPAQASLAALASATATGCLLNRSYSSPSLYRCTWRMAWHMARACAAATSLLLNPPWHPWPVQLDNGNPGVHARHYAFALCHWPQLPGEVRTGRGCAEVSSNAGRASAAHRCLENFPMRTLACAAA